MQSPVKVQIPALLPAKEHVEEVVAEKMQLQLFLLKAKSAVGCRSGVCLNLFCHNREEALKLKARL